MHTRVRQYTCARTSADCIAGGAMKSITHSRRKRTSSEHESASRGGSAVGLLFHATRTSHTLSREITNVTRLSGTNHRILAAS